MTTGQAIHDKSGPRAGFVFPVRVYYEDTDAGGVVYYANYLRFFERARTEWLRSTGVSQYTLAETTHLMFVVRRAHIDYHSPARLDDCLTIVSRIAKAGRVALDFAQEAWRGEANSGELLARGLIKVACVDRITLRPTPLPESLRKDFVPSLST